MTRPIYPATMADMLAHRAGEKYRPSNGSEGEFFLDAFCRRCQRDGHNVDDDNGERCAILGLSMIYNAEEPEYPGEWQYGHDGQPCCTAFVEAGQAIPEPRCTKTQELF